MTISRLRQRLEQQRGQFQAIQQSLIAQEIEQERLRLEALEIEEAGLILGVVAKKTQEQIGIYLDDMVSVGTEAVFPHDTDYRFAADFVQRRGQTEVDLMLADSHGNRIRPSDQDGGGLVDVVAFLLRVALWTLGRDTRPVIILDEPFRNLHGREDQRRASELIKRLSERLGLQFIIITGEDEGPELLAGADQTILVRKVHGSSKITRK
jgi:DNA repair exonuclease SbcCD ATPase subunit